MAADMRAEDVEKQKSEKKKPPGEGDGDRQKQKKAVLNLLRSSSG